MRHTRLEQLFVERGLLKTKDIYLHLSQFGQISPSTIYRMRDPEYYPEKPVVELLRMAFPGLEAWHVFDFRD